MRILTFTLAIMLLGGCSASTKNRTITNTKSNQVTSYETVGNLKATKQISCVEVSSLSSQHTPADIYIGISDCISKSDATRAAKLFSLAGTYGWYDRLRVADRTAHQALRVLQMTYLAPASEEFKSQLKIEMGIITKKDSPEFENICQIVKSLGKPSYYPHYMIQHGISAFTGKMDGLNSDFSEEDSWNNALDKYLHCPV